MLMIVLVVPRLFMMVKVMLKLGHLRTNYIKSYCKCRPQKKKWFFVATWRIGLFNSGNGLCRHTPVLQTLALLSHPWSVSHLAQLGPKHRKSNQKPDLGKGWLCKGAGHCL